MNNSSSAPRNPERPPPQKKRKRGDFLVFPYSQEKKKGGIFTSPGTAGSCDLLFYLVRRAAALVNEPLTRSSHSHASETRSPPALLDIRGTKRSLGDMQFARTQKKGQIEKKSVLQFRQNRESSLISGRRNKKPERNNLSHSNRRLR
ncbi:hypothetical protein CDAR_194221 [Caerostris darwini]|uniref:Uncharacterized protein n=1 Tax=Caerostris darwini TaxID=1538125 RepID=A0AAV4Q3G7_9ARAC|nr:hypothetical protein CDAR_194221 [Caerostris darwini]